MSNASIFQRLGSTHRFESTANSGKSNQSTKRSRLTKITKYIDLVCDKTENSRLGGYFLHVFDQHAEEIEFSYFNLRRNRKHSSTVIFHRSDRILQRKYYNRNHQNVWEYFTCNSWLYCYWGDIGSDFSGCGFTIVNFSSQRDVKLPHLVPCNGE